MNVREVSRTTLSLIIFTIGVVYLNPILKYVFPYMFNNQIVNVFFYTLAERLHPQNYLGWYYPFIVNVAILIIILIGMLDAILKNRVAFGLLFSLDIPIILCCSVIIMAFIPLVNLYVFWGALQLAVIIGIYWMFRRIMQNIYSKGQKMIPFVKEIKMGGGKPICHVFDHYTVFGSSLLLLAVYTMLLLSFLVYVTSGSDFNIEYTKSSNIRVFIERRQVAFDVNPLIVDGRTLVPMRAVFEAFGLEVKWDDISRTAEGISPDKNFKFVIGSNKVLVDGQEKSIDVPAAIIGGRTLIPLRFLSENMGYNVVWNGDAKLILLSKN